MNNEITMTELTGTEKQVKWASQIRSEAIDYAQRMVVPVKKEAKYGTERVQNMRAVVTTEAAKYTTEEWITYHKNGSQEFMKNIVSGLRQCGEENIANLIEEIVM